MHAHMHARMHTHKTRKIQASITQESNLCPSTNENNTKHKGTIYYQFGTVSYKAMAVWGGGQDDIKVEYIENYCRPSTVPYFKVALLDRAKMGRWQWCIMHLHAFIQS